MILAAVVLVKSLKSAVVPRMNKQLILDRLIKKVDEELSVIKEAHLSQKAFATDQEFKAESKYDTRAIEAGYLAQAEQKRLEELELERQILSEVDLRQRDQVVSIGSLVELEFKGQKALYFLIPTAGGTLHVDESQVVVVVSVFSPLGDSLLGLGVGDEFEVETPKEMRQYRILSIV